MADNEKPSDDALMDEPPPDEESERFPVLPTSLAASNGRVSLSTAEDTAEALRVLKSEAMMVLARSASSNHGANTNLDLGERSHGTPRGPGHTRLTRAAAWVTGLSLGIFAAWWFASTADSAPRKRQHAVPTVPESRAAAAAPSRPGQAARSPKGPVVVATSPGSAPPDAPEKPEDAAGDEPNRAAAAFDRQEAKAALSDAAPLASRCRQRGDPTGIARVAVTFEPSGHARSVRVLRGPFQDTNTGRCISERLASVRVTPFSGEHTTVSHPIPVF